MEKLLEQIGDLIKENIAGVDEIRYVDEKMGAMFYIFFVDGKKVLLSLVDSNL